MPLVAWPAAVDQLIKGSGITPESAHMALCESADHLRKKGFWIVYVDGKYFWPEQGELSPDPATGDVHVKSVTHPQDHSRQALWESGLLGVAHVEQSAFDEILLREKLNNPLIATVRGSMQNTNSFFVDQDFAR